MPLDLGDHDAIGLASLVAAREVTPDELLEASLAALAAWNPHLNAVVHLAADHGRAMIAKGLPDGPFRGVPFLVKDLSLAMAGLPMGNGSRFWAGFTPDADTTLAERYRTAGLVVFGRTASPELGLGPITEPVANGPCRNPWNTGRQTGGSSGGAAAAVAARIVPIAHATDGGGSIRMPAAHCGVFGFKPSRGRMPIGPVLGEGWSGLSVPHCVAISVRDSAALMDATMGPAPGDPYGAPALEVSCLEAARREPGRLRIAVTTTTPRGDPVHPEVAAAVEATAKLCAGLGHHVEVAAAPFDIDELYRNFWTLAGANSAVAIAARAKALGRPPRADELEPSTWAVVNHAKSLGAEDYARTLQWMHGLGRRVGLFFERYDVALSPVYTNPPLPVGSITMGIAEFEVYTETLIRERPFTAVHNMCGTPAMSLPLGWTADGLPIGVQAATRYGADDILWSLAAQIETAAPWRQRRPTLPKAG